MLFNRILSLLAIALVLAGCSASATIPPPTPVPDTPTSAATSDAQPTTASTQAPEPTAIPTDPPQPTEAPTQAPTAVPTAVPTAISTAVPTAIPTVVQQLTTAPTQTPPAQAASGAEILFLRERVLWAFDINTRSERRIIDNVSDYAAAPGGAQIALLRGSGRATELWLVGRDGSNLTQITSDDRMEATLAWSLGGKALAYSSAATDAPYQRVWPEWAEWCRTSKVHVFDPANSSITALADGCDPSISPDGRRVAYAAPPTDKEPGLDSISPTIKNSIRLINRQGQNGWDFAKASGDLSANPRNGRLVYAPSWSPDGAQIVYHRFIGYWALVDISLSEIGGSFDGKGQPLNNGAGWLLPAQFAPNGRALAIVQYNYSDAAGYDPWSVSVIRLGGTSSSALPDGEMTLQGSTVDALPGAQSAAWSPDGAAMAVLLPVDWQPKPEPGIISEGPGEIWRWVPGNAPAELLVRNVDYGSPVVWLPGK